MNMLPTFELSIFIASFQPVFDTLQIG